MAMERDKINTSIISPQHAFWAMGFRPFFLFGALCAVLIILPWLGVLNGWAIVSWPGKALYWHAHEMLYGFVVAIVAGFLLTATQNWSGIRGVHGRPLQLLVFVWMVPRFLSFFSSESALWICAFLSVLFYALLLYSLKPYLMIAKQKRNWIFVGLLSSLCIGEILFFLEVLGFYQNTARISLYLATYVVLTMITVIGGRVIPFFTKNASPSATINTSSRLDLLTLLSTVGLGVLQLVFKDSSIFTWACFFTFSVHFIRWVRWDFMAALASPILLVLYAGYFWLIVGFLLIGLGAFGVLPETGAFHALTAGAMGVMILGMITRVSLGHSGRQITASKLIVASYIVLNISVLLRVLGPIIFINDYSLILNLSGLFWAFAFALFIFEYYSILTQPRLDGKSG